MHDISTMQRMTYLRGLLQSHGTLSLPLGSGLSFSLLQIFQPLRLRQSATDEPKQPKNKNDETQHDRHEPLRENNEPEEKKQSAPDVLAENGIEALNKSQHGRIVILGGPGTGKTTVLKHLLYHYVQQALEESTAPLPIFLSLPELARVSQDLDTYLVHIAQEMGLDADYGRNLFHAIEYGHAFVCLDSLDEVLPRQRAGIIRQINELAQKNGNSWIVGSRFTDYKGGQFQYGQFQEWELQPLDHERRLRLATQLLPELQHQLAISTQPTPSPQAYVQALGEHRQAATWGTNPLLFSLGAVAYLRRGTLSGSRAMLYREVVNALLETRGGDAQLRQALAHIALALYQVKGRTFTLEDLYTVLTSLNVEQQASWNVEEMRYRVLNSGILDVVAAETYSFRHQTFQEYLAASALAERFMSRDEQTCVAAHQLAWSKHTYSRWNQIERLLVGILAQEYGDAGMLQARSWLTRLLEQRQTLAGDPGNLSLELAINVLGEVAQLEEWQAAKTLALEEMAAVVWSEEVKRASQNGRGSGRYLVTAADIGRLRPSAQQKAIEPLLKARVDGLSAILGAIHSPFLTQYLLEALERYPDSHDQRRIKNIFEYMGEFAPIDFLLNELISREKDLDDVKKMLEQLALYVPAEKLVPVLQMSGGGHQEVAENILKKIAQVKELPMQELLNLLYGDQEDVSFCAACVLAEAQHPAAINLLLAHLNDFKEHERVRALCALGQYKTLMPLDRVKAMLEDKEKYVRWTTVKVLASLGSAAPLEPLIRATRDSSAWVRQEAIEALGDLGDQVPLDVLVQATNDSQTNIVKAAILAIGKLGHSAALELLLGFLDQKKFVHSTLEALSQKQIVGRVPVQPLLDMYEWNWQERKEILNILINMGHPVVSDLLIKAVSDEYQFGEHETWRYGGKTYKMFTAEQAAITQLLGQKAVNVLIAKHIDEVEARCYPAYNRAVAILGSWQDRRALDVLLQALADERWRVSDAAANELCKRSGELVQADLLVLLKHRHAWVRKNALLIMAECTGPFPVEPLVAALHDSNEQIRAAAAKALRRVHEEDAPLEELFAATLNDSITVRREAVVTLSKWGRRNPALAVAGVMNLLRLEVSIGDYPLVDGCQAATEAFDELSSFVPADILLQAMYDSGRIEIADFVADALSKMGERMPVEELAYALQDQHEHIRHAAVIALSMSGKRAPVAAFIKALHTEDSDEFVHSVVLRTLAKISEHGNVPDEIFLDEILKKSDYNTCELLFQAFNSQGKRISQEIVLDVLEHLFYAPPSVVEYLSRNVDQLAAFPEKCVVVLLALYIAEQRHGMLVEDPDEPETAEIIGQLLSKISQESILDVAAQREVTRRERAIRVGALYLLGEYPGTVPLEAILLALHDPDYQVRHEAIVCLQKRSESLPIQSIIACLQDTDIGVCRRAIIVLANLGAQAPLSELMAMLDALAPDVRAAAIEGLAQPGLFEQVPTKIFINALGESYGDTYNNEERYSVLNALCQRDLSVAIEHCIAALSDNNDEFALDAFQLLQQIQPAIIPDIIGEARQLFQGGKPGRFFRTLNVGFLADVIGDIDQAVPDLIVRLGELLDWPYWEVRMKAARALGRQRRNIPDATIRRLLELRRDPRSRAVREAADTALAEILSLETGIEDD